MVGWGGGGRGAGKRGAEECVCVCVCAGAPTAVRVCHILHLSLQLGCHEHVYTRSVPGVHEQASQQTTHNSRSPSSVSSSAAGWGPRSAAVGHLPHPLPLLPSPRLHPQCHHRAPPPAPAQQAPTSGQGHAPLTSCPRSQALPHWHTTKCRRVRWIRHSSGTSFLRTPQVSNSLFFPAADAPTSSCTSDSAMAD